MSTQNDKSLLLDRDGMTCCLWLATRSWAS